MAAWVCDTDPAVCRAVVAVGTERCPQCGGTEFHEQGDETMAKVSRLGGPSDRNTPRAVDEEPPVVEVQDDAEVFVPGEHTVAEVLEYLDALDDDNSGERQRVLAAERNGQNRKGIVGS